MKIRVSNFTAQFIFMIKLSHTSFLLLSKLTVILSKSRGVLNNTHKTYTIVVKIGALQWSSAAREECGLNLTAFKYSSKRYGYVL